VAGYTASLPESNFEWDDGILEAARRQVRIRNLTAKLINAYTFGRLRSVPGLRRQLEELDPDGAWTMYFQALAAYDEDERGSALVACEAAIQKDPRLSRAWNLKGLLLLDAERAEEAKTAFRQAVEHNPYSPNHAYNLATALHRLGRDDAALAYAERAVELRVNFSEALYLQGLLLYRLERPRESLSAMVSAREFGMEGERFYFDYLRIAEAAENDKELIVAVRNLANTQDALVLRELGRIHLHFGEFEAAVLRLRLLADKPEADMEDWKNLVRAAVNTDASVIRELRRLRLEPEQYRALVEYYQELRAAQNESLQPREPVVNSKWRLMHE